jgi:trehalose 6-phosphate synthase
MSPIVLVSNRGPVNWQRTDGGLVAKRGAGGLVSGLAPLVAGTDGLWIASALSDGDREAARAGMVEADGLRCRLLAHDRQVLRSAYDVVGNAVLWFIHHGLYELARRPRFDAVFARAWTDYRTYNHTFADAVIEAAPFGATVLVQDYHLALVSPPIRAARPDLRLVHFSHTPFAGPDWFAVLPEAYRAEILQGMASNDACCFHTERWRRNFEASCREFGVEPPSTAVTPLGPDPTDLEATVTSEAARRAGERLQAAVGNRRLIVRVDRIELSKNLLRGFWAYEDLLERYPEWRERVCFVAQAYPSREGLADYLAYRQEIEHLVGRINQRWGTEDWTPILFDPNDDFPRSVAALTRYDVLLVNPIRDGMNLVAKEGPLVNTIDGVVVLSTEAGAWDELQKAALGVHPYDITGTADTLARALTMPQDERRQRAAMLNEQVRGQGPDQWLAGQLAAAAS